MKRTILTIIPLMALCGTSQAILTSGDIAIIARQNNGSPDSFSFVNLTTLAPGDVVYFTDNGWNQSTPVSDPVPAPPAFRSPSGTDGNGSEQLMKFTVQQPISAGTIISSVGTSTAWSWDVSSLPQGSDAGGNFTHLSLNAGGDQIYAFTASDTLPLQNVTSLLYLLDDTGTLEDATSAITGSPGPLQVGQTAVLVNRMVGGTISLDVNDPDVQGLQTSGGTREQWLAVIGNSSNWNLSATSQPVGSLSIIAPIPEPSVPLLAWSAGAVILLRRRIR